MSLNHRDLFVDPTRLRVVEEGIWSDNRCKASSGQDDEHAMRDAVAAACLGSPQAAVREATRHHSRDVMLDRASEQVNTVVSKFDEPKRVVVDLGCGFGWHWIDLAARHRSVCFVLIDFSITNLKVCRSLMPIERYPNVMCVQANILDLPLRDSVAALAWSVQVLQHITSSDRRAAFHEVRRILMPGASFYIAWLRTVPLVRWVMRVFRRRYHIAGMTPYGYYLDRFSPSVEDDARSVFPSARITRSESLFHPELRMRLTGQVTARLDAILSSSPLGALLARQSELRGSL